MTTTLFHPIDPWGYFGDRGKDQNNFPGDGINSHQSTREWTSASAQEAEASSSLAPAKPVIKENNIQIEVSNLFTPLEIMLYNDGLGRGQVGQFRQVQGAVTTALRT